MKEEAADFIRIDNPVEVGELVVSLTEPGAASIALDRAGFEPQPVVVVDVIPGECVVLDVTASGASVPQVRRAGELRLIGQGVDGMLSTPLLAVREWLDVDGRVHCRCDYPAEMKHYQRRDAYRAPLRLGMQVGVLVRGAAADKVTFQGDLRNLSLSGCLVDLPPNAAGIVEGAKLELELCFPNGTRFVVEAEPRHRDPDGERCVLAVGFAFIPTTQEQDRLLWFYVREIERESARGGAGEVSSLQPSALFESRADEPEVGLRNALPYATPMARRLARVAGYLDSLVMELREGNRVDPVLLSRAADRLLGLHAEDREALLFATVCLWHDPQVVQHAVAVAVRLVDIGQAFKMPRDLLKAMAACAMVHDLGKVLLPPEVLTAASRDDEQERSYREHVKLLLPRLESCHWLSRTVRDAVVKGANERVDGSGYPHGWRGAQLHELTRLAAVVVEVDRLGRYSREGEGLSIEVIHRRLTRNAPGFDPRWVARYFEHFGRLPVGTLVRFPGGEMGWVLGLDEAGEPGRVQLTGRREPPGEALGEIVGDDPLRQLGPAEALVSPGRKDAPYD
ncbi:HD domain-containing phosphohydrolase [Parahaliea mediterranea]|uniref:PilZ domain-containing protein n=1 Tax=Parahaliea mediterranea TaxID=651086 RepID=A0A939DE40_9GAMM|nr:HD domain-containing phosphohydrolase [Parahaliea mediterranea]MBN7795822.1 PilZ domain-containing protein [Parahaliea mediterranea]